MHVASLEVGDFRNYEYTKVEFHEKTNIFYGDNAQGKTNLLEALYLCSMTKSHKGSKDKELIRIGKDEAHIKVCLEKRGVPHRIDLHLKKGRGKGIAIDGIPVKRSLEVLGLFHVVFFSPEDLGIVKNGPSERRKFLNMELCQLDSMYLYDLTEYNKVLEQRNKLLKQISFQPSLKETLDIWDTKLLEYGEKVIQRRKEFIEELGEIVVRVNERLTGGKEKISIFYEPDVSKEEFEKKLMASREKDLKLCSTGVGPHRDDICFLEKEADLRKYGSQGQQRTLALSLKLAEIDLVKEKINDTPVLLLDDVLSELDRNRQNYLLESLEEVQTMITCTGIEEFVDSRLTLDRIFHVVDGTVTQK